MLGEVDALYERLLLPLLPPPFFSYSYGYHVSPRLPPPAKKETAHWFSVTKAASHWLLVSPALPRLLSPWSLEEPGKEAQARAAGAGACRDRAAAIVSGPCRLPRAGIETAGGEEARPAGLAGPAGPAGVAGSAWPAGVGAPACSTDSCSSPEGRTCQVSGGAAAGEKVAAAGLWLLLGHTAEDREAEHREGGVEVRRGTRARLKKSLAVSTAR